MKKGHHTGAHFQLAAMLDSMNLGRGVPRHTSRQGALAGCFQPRSLLEARKLRLAKVRKPRFGKSLDSVEDGVHVTPMAIEACQG